MKKLIIMSIWIIFSAGFIFSLNCSKPLDVGRITPGSTDTLFVNDTIIFTDTVYVDTLFLDTLYVDTLYADTMLCARLDSHRQEIVWLLFNQKGIHRLEFLAFAERVRRSQELMVDIDGQLYYWDLSDSLSFSVEHDLDDFATIKISSTQPHAYGQSIDICLRVAEP